MANRAYTTRNRTWSFPRNWQGHFDSVSDYIKRGATAAAAAVGGYFGTKMPKRKAPPIGRPMKRRRRNTRAPPPVRTGRKIPVVGMKPRRGKRGRSRRSATSKVAEVNPHGGDHIEYKLNSGRKMKRSRLSYKMSLVTSEKNIDRYQALTYPKSNMGFYLMDRQTNTN